MKAALFFIVVIFYIFLVMFFLQSISDIVFPILQLAKSVIYEEKVKIEELSPLLATYKILAIISCSYLIFVTGSIISAVFTNRFIKDRTDEIKYREYELNELTFRAISWNYHRLSHVIAPTLLILAFIAGFALIFFVLFNYVIYLASLSIAVSAFVSSFIIQAVFLSFIMAFVTAVWRSSNTLYGMEILIVEPDLSNKEIVRRSSGLAFALRKNYLLHFIYILFVLCFAAQALSVFINNNSLSPENLSLISIATIIDLSFYTALGYLKTNYFIDSLVHKYNKISLLNEKGSKIPA